MVAADALHRACHLYQRRMVDGGIQGEQGIEERGGLLRGDASPALSGQQDVQDFHRPEGGHDGLFTGLEPVEHPQRHGRLLIGKAPGQGDGGIEHDAHGRASRRSSRRVMPPRERP